MILFYFFKYARQYSRNETITFNWLCTQVAWPFSLPKTILDLVHLEAIFDVLDLYLWFSYRFMDLFPDAKLVRDIQKELDEIIQQGVFQITKLLQNSETATSMNQPDEDNFAISQRKNYYYKDHKATPLRGRLTERLLAQGLLTPSMLQELRKEWDVQGPTRSPPGSDDEDSPFSKKARRKRTKK